MQLKNNADRYGSIAKWLHWTTAILFLASYSAVYYRHWFTENKTTENWVALQFHLSVGISIAAVVVLRLIWRSFNPPPAPLAESRMAQLAIHLGHYSLYAIMILAPLTGYIGTGVDTEFFLLFDIAKFESTSLYQLIVNDWMSMSFEEFEAPIDFFHKEIMGKWLVWLLILGHVIAALYHHFVKKDDTLKRMTTGA
jgi:cytochrome b561